MAHMETISAAPRSISVLGSTGSIGVNTLDVVAQLGGRDAFDVMALTGNANIGLLVEQAKATGARFAVTASDKHYHLLKEALSGTGIEAGAGNSGLHDAASMNGDIVVAAIVGTAGLAPTLAAARRGATIALANKECLVTAGELFLDAVNDGGGKLVPVDSEHSAIFQVLETDQRHAIVGSRACRRGMARGGRHACQQQSQCSRSRHSHSGSTASFNRRHAGGEVSSSLRARNCAP